MNKKVVVCLAVTIVLLLCASAALAVINRLFKSQLDQSRFLLGQVESSVKQLQKDREQALRDNEKLQALLNAFMNTRLYKNMSKKAEDIIILDIR